MIIQYAKVTSIKDGVPYVTFLGEDAESKTKYTRLANYNPIVGDMVAIIVDSKNKKIIIGKVI